LIIDALWMLKGVDDICMFWIGNGHRCALIYLDDNNGQLIEKTRMKEKHAHAIAVMACLD